MKKLAKLVGKDIKEVVVAISDTPDEEYFLERGYTWQEVEQGYDLKWYLKGNAPKKSLEKLKEEEKQQINTERNAKEQSIFLFDGQTYDADKDSIQRISVAAQNALAAKITDMPYEIDWTLADNSDVTLDADGMLGVSQALAVHAATVHAIARELKAAVDAAETPEELEAITWPD